MKILMMEPEKRPYPMEIPKDLNSLQTAVGGLIQVLYPFDDSVMLVCNEEGKISGLPLNRGLRHPDTGELYDVISGNFFVCDGNEEGEFSSLTEEQVAKYSILFHSPETFLMVNGKLCCFPIEPAN